MKRKSGTRLFLVLTGAAALGVALFGWREVAARRDWQAMRPEIPAPVGARAPGLDARFESCAVRLKGLPPDRAALAEVALLGHANGQVDSAMRAYAALELLEPETGRWPMMHAAIHASYGRLDQALPLLRTAVARSPDHVPAWLRLGDVLFKADNIPMAIGAYEEVLRRAPENVHALYGLARCALREERWTGARVLLQQAVAAAPHFAPAHHLLATVHERLGNTDAADAALVRGDSASMQLEPADPWMDELIDHCHDIYRLRVAAATAMSAGDTARALAICDRAHALAPDDGRVQWEYGKIHLRAGQFDLARRYLERAVDLDPGNEKALLDLIRVLQQTGDTPAVTSMRETYERRFGLVSP